ncbi:MAG: AI-2E family transporter [Bacteroidetes bacterium]|uniref:AI-2E family transporter n=1 Tax=Candidatus Cryptobacteroides faecigallinarum TaxID=2840763 RepID=A0A9D9INL9_9BACT|nr:AI-2E family transporter [Candidatus Cryptobacteroides faecigallinarum]
MEKECWRDTLSKYIIYTALAVVIGAICWYFRNIIIYILIAGVLSLIGSPLAESLKKIHIRKWKFPDWAASIVTIVIILSIFLAVVTLIVPIVTSIVKDVSMVNVGNTVKSISVPLHDLNMFLIEKFPNLGPDFKIETFIVEQLQKLFDVSMLSSLLSSVTSFVASFGVAIFSIIFIVFFFFKENGMFSRIIASLVPDRLEKKAMDSIDDIRHLLSRYFLGLLVEICGVALINFLGLMFVAKMGFSASIGIAFMTGVMNIVPYVGPWIGGAIGTVLGITMKFVCTTHIGIDVNFWTFVIIMIAIFCVTQIVDNYLFQPIIYSSSIKAHPLEIFIVLLMAGTIGGIIGMLVAIPCYTVIRVIAGRFFRNVKFIRQLIPEDSREAEHGFLWRKRKTQQ